MVFMSIGRHLGFGNIEQSLKKGISFVQSGSEGGHASNHVRIKGILLREDGGKLCEYIGNVGNGRALRRHERLFSNFAANM